MYIILAVILGIIGYFLTEKYQDKVGGWGNAYAIYVSGMLFFVIVYTFLTN